MDSKLLLVKCITIVYLQSLLTDNKNDRIKVVVNKVLDIVKPVEKSISTDFGHDTITQLRETLVWLVNRGNEPLTQSELKQRFILNTQDDTYILNALNTMFVDDNADEEKIQKDIRSYIYDINSYLDQKAMIEVFKHYYKQAQFNPESIDWSNIANEVNEALQPFSIKGEKAAAHPSIVNSINFGEVLDIQEALTRSKDELSSLGTIKLPYQGWNRMLGAQRGLRRGEFGVVAALQHNYKSGTLLDAFIGCATLNTPYMRDETKKPLNFRISFENPAEMDIKLIYERMYEQETGIRVDVETIDIDTASNYIFEKLAVNGYENKLVYIDPSDFNILDLINLLEETMAEGYEIHLLTLDYLPLMSKKYLNQGATGEDIRDLYRRTRNFTSKHGIACLTAHQLSSDAKELIRQGANKFLELIANKGYYDGCKRLDQEVDLEIYQHIEKVNGESFLAARRGKHRGVRTPILDQFTVYKFDEIKGLPYDLNTEDQSRRVVGGGTMSEGASDPWYNNVAA